MLVSIHAPARGATILTYQNRQSNEFQSTHPRGVRQVPDCVEVVQSRFNPRTREGCDSLKERNLLYRLCFNPRTREGCDRPSSPEAADGTGFNPRTREGCDTFFLRAKRRREVSIHAPARGATRNLNTYLNTVRFQSTHPRGVRLTEGEAEQTTEEFQSTHPRGVRPYAHAWGHARACFNPRTREGCDTFR